MKVPTIALKNIRHAEFASEETYCFSATVYVDGKPFCTASNDGHGGPNRYDALKATDRRPDIEALDALLARGPVVSFGEMTMDNCLELEIGNRISEWLLLKEAKRILKRITYTKGDGTRDLYQLPAKHKPTPENLEKVKKAEWWGPQYRMISGDLSPEAVVKEFLAE